jgi:hypothetical protein
MWNHFFSSVELCTQKKEAPKQPYFSVSFAAAIALNRVSKFYLHIGDFLFLGDDWLLLGHHDIWLGLGINVCVLDCDKTP